MTLIYSSDADRIVEDVRRGRINRRIAAARMQAFAPSDRQAAQALLRAEDLADPGDGARRPRRRRFRFKPFAPVR